MKYYQLLFVFVINITFLQAQDGNINSNNLESNLKSSAQTMGQLFIENKLTEYVKFVHPKIIDMLGGQDKMIEVLNKSIKQIESEGFTFKNVTIGDPSKIITVTNELQSVVPQILELKNKSGSLTVTSYLLGISNDNGKTWYFIDTGGKTLEQMKKVFPTLSNELIIPPKKQPVFIND